MRRRLSLAIASFACALVFATAATAADPLVSRGGIENARGFATTQVVNGLNSPWGMTWLPDGTLLITQKSGTIRVVRDGALMAQSIDFPGSVLDLGQGGLMDIATSPDFETDNLLYFTYATGDPQANQTAIGRATWTGDGLAGFTEIFRVAAAKEGGAHFGSRLLFLPDGTLLASIGDGGNPPITFASEEIRQQAQSLQTHFGSVIRINPDGSVPDDNPFVATEGARPEIWSYGHRNIQGMAFDPETKAIWASEHGAAGGDELNRLEAGNNYGWPAVTYARNYGDGTLISDRIAGPGYTAPVVVWLDTHAPAGATVYRGADFPDWQGGILSSGLVTQDLRLIMPQAGKKPRHLSIPIGKRVRDVDVDPDGKLYALTDGENGALIRIHSAAK